MNAKPIALASLWGISIAAALLIGKALTPTNAGDDSRPPTKSSNNSTHSRGAVLRTSGESTASLASARARLEAAPMVRKGSSPQEMIEDIARFKDVIERNNALLALIDSLSPEQFLSVVDAFRQTGITRERLGEYEMLLTAWAKVNPSEALDYASKNTQGGFARNTILATWATTHPDAAIAWAKANHNPEDGANPWLVGVIEGIAPYDISRATDLMETLPRSGERGDALRTVISQLMEKGPDDAKNWTATIEDDYLRSGAYAFTADYIAQKEPAHAAQWLADIGDVDALNRAGKDISGKWYRKDPEAAKKWVNTLPPEAMSEAAEGIVDRIVRDDPVAAAQYLSDLATSNPDANFDSSIRELVRGASRQDPELAAIWVGGLSSDNDQTRYYHSILGDWRNRDSEAAMTWMQANEAALPKSIGRRFLGRERQPQQ